MYLLSVTISTHKPIVLSKGISSLHLMCLFHIVYWWETIFLQIVVESCETAIKSLEIQLVRVETCGCAEGFAKDGNFS